MHESILVVLPLPHASRTQLQYDCIPIAHYSTPFRPLVFTPYTIQYCALQYLVKAKFRENEPENAILTPAMCHRPEAACRLQLRSVQQCPGVKTLWLELLRPPLVLSAPARQLCDTLQLLQEKELRLCHEIPEGDALQALSHEIPEGDALQALSHEIPEGDALQALSHEIPEGALTQKEELPGVKGGDVTLGASGALAAPRSQQTAPPLQPTDLLPTLHTGASALHTGVSALHTSTSALHTGASAGVRGIGPLAGSSARGSSSSSSSSYYSSDEEEGGASRCGSGSA